MLSRELGLQHSAYDVIPRDNTHTVLPASGPSEEPVVQLSSYNFIHPDNPPTARSSIPQPEEAVLQQGAYNSSISRGNSHSSPLSFALRDLEYTLPQGQMLSNRPLTAAASVLSKHSAQLQQDLTKQGNSIMALHAANLHHSLNTGQSMPKAAPADQALTAPGVPSPATCMGDMLSRALQWKHSQQLPQANVSMMQASCLQADMAPQPDYLQEMYDLSNPMDQQAPAQQASGYATQYPG